MRVLFVTAGALPDSGSFPAEYVSELKKRCTVLQVHCDFENSTAAVCDDGRTYRFAPVPDFETLSPDMRIFEKVLAFRRALAPLTAEFEPDIIQCMGMRAFLPFRFDSGVVYAEWQEEGDGGYDAFYFQKLKIRRYALTASLAAVVYSEGDARSAVRLCGGKCAPLVLPAGIAQPPNAARAAIPLCIPDARSSRNSAKSRSVLCVAPSSGSAETFLSVIEQLGSGFKAKYGLCYALAPAKSHVLFGYGSAPLIDCIGEPVGAGDIVIIPQASGDSFRFDALKAMAKGSLLIMPRSEGAAAFAEYGANCLELCPGRQGMRAALVNAVVNFDSYTAMRTHAARTGAAWNIERSVSAHLYVYHLLLRGKLPHLISAYTEPMRRTLVRFTHAKRAERQYAAERELRAIRLIAHAAEKAEWVHQGRGCRTGGRPILALTGAYSAADAFPSINVVSTLAEGMNGIVVRPECLPFADRAYPVVVAVGAWETVEEPCTALMEMQRVTESLLIILFRENLPYSWQTATMGATPVGEAFAGKDFYYAADGASFSAAAEWDGQEGGTADALFSEGELPAVLRRIREATGYRAAVFVGRRQPALHAAAHYRSAEYATPP